MIQTTNVIWEFTDTALISAVCHECGAQRDGIVVPPAEDDPAWEGLPFGVVYHQYLFAQIHQGRECR